MIERAASPRGRHPACRSDRLVVACDVRACDVSAAALPGRRDADLLRALRDQHAHALWSYVVGLTGGDRGKAQDVVQETLLRAWRNPAVLDQTGGSGRGWLFTVARRIVIDECARPAGAQRW